MICFLNLALFLDAASQREVQSVASMLGLSMTFGFPAHSSTLNPLATSPSMDAEGFGRFWTPHMSNKVVHDGYVSQNFYRQKNCAGIQPQRAGRSSPVSVSVQPKVWSPSWELVHGTGQVHDLDETATSWWKSENLVKPAVSKLHARESSNRSTVQVQSPNPASLTLPRNGSSYGLNRGQK